MVWPTLGSRTAKEQEHHLQVERRTRKVRRPETDVIPLCHATNSLVSALCKFDVTFVDTNQSVIETIWLNDMHNFSVLVSGGSNVFSAFKDGHNKFTFLNCNQHFANFKPYQFASAV